MKYYGRMFSVLLSAQGPYLDKFIANYRDLLLLMVENVNLCSYNSILEYSAEWGDYIPPLFYYFTVIIYIVFSCTNVLGRVVLLNYCDMSTTRR